MPWTFAATAVAGGDSLYRINVADRPRAVFVDLVVDSLPGYQPGREHWLKISAEASSAWGAFETALVMELHRDERLKRTACRMQNGTIQRYADWHPICCCFRIPPDFAGGQLSIFAETRVRQDIRIQKISVQLLRQ